MRRKHLEYHLSSLQREFPSPEIQLEQYPTSFELTAAVTSFASERGDLGAGRTALDLGCGTGMLLAGCILAGCDSVIGVDCDEAAIQVAKANVQHLKEQLDSDYNDGDEEGEGEDLWPVEFILARIKGGGGAQKTNEKKHFHRSKGKRKGGKGKRAPIIPAVVQEQQGAEGEKEQTQRQQLQDKSSVTNDDDDDDDDDDGLSSLQDNCVDTVLTNPPFGTKHNEGMDVRFLQTAIRLSRHAVYSFHKTSTRDYLLRKIRNEWGHEARVVAAMKFDIPNTYKFHQRKSVDVAVDLIHVIKNKKQHQQDKQKDNTTGDDESTKVNEEGQDSLLPNDGETSEE